jgi:hypothetical protein
MHRAPTYLLILVAGWVSTGCSKDISRGRAGDLIANNQDFSSPYKVKLPVGDFWWDARTIDSIDSNVMKKLEQNGVLTLRRSGKYSWVYTEVVVDLTPLGRDESKAWTIAQKDFHANGAPCNGKSAFCIPPSNAVLYSAVMAQRHLKQVTGIRLDPGGKEAAAEFEFVWLPTREKVSEGIVNPDVVFRGRADFQLYDDGWRLSAIHLP